MITLALDACTYVGTVAILRDRVVLAECKAEMRGREADRLMPAVADCVAQSGIPLTRLDRVACGAGPGSFTSLRIAASIAKGIAVGRAIPLFAMSSLALVVAAQRDAEPGRYLAAMDALRGESYARAFELSGDGLAASGELRLLPTDALPAAANELGARLVGPEREDRWLPHARGLARLEIGGLVEGPVDCSSWEPLYGRLAEAQVRWEAVNRRPLPT